MCEQCWWFWSYCILNFQLHSLEKNGIQITRKLIYCAVHRLELWCIYLMFSQSSIFYCSYQWGGIHFWLQLIVCHICWFMSCFQCRTPNPDAVVVVHTPSGVFAARNSLQNQKGCFRGARVVPSERTELPEPSTSETNEFEPLSAARCCAFKRSNYKVICVRIFAPLSLSFDFCFPVEFLITYFIWMLWTFFFLPHCFWVDLLIVLCSLFSTREVSS